MIVLEANTFPLANAIRFSQAIFVTNQAGLEVEFSLTKKESERHLYPVFVLKKDQTRLYRNNNGEKHRISPSTFVYSKHTDKIPKLELTVMTSKL